MHIIKLRVICAKLAFLFQAWTLGNTAYGTQSNCRKPPSLDLLLKVPGVLWVEPVLTTYARNLAASAYMSDGDIATQDHWEFGLNGSGVVLGVADSGLDIDHSCFRNNSESVGDVGANHRKVLVNM